MMNHLEFLKNLKQHTQKSEGWFNQRKNKLTSSDAATALGINPYKKATELLLEKCGAGKSFEGNESTLHGQKYEDEAIEKYEFLMEKINHTFGMISFSDLDPIRSTKDSRKYINQKYHFLGGSPDGISVDIVITNESVLTQLEVKCPLRRKIKHGQIPDYYFPQVQLNMFILDLEVTDFIEYMPSIIGKSVELNIVRVYRDEEWFEKNFPILEKFWTDVLYWRTQDIKTHPEYNKYFGTQIGPILGSIRTTPKFLFIEDNSEERSKSPFENQVCLFED
jgi:putative phage-type endonuclease